MCALRGPHLLERRPVVRRPLAGEEPAAVGALEPDIHLQAAVVRRIRVGPRTFIAVDAEPLTLVRRILGPCPSLRRDALPDRDLRRDVRRRVLELAGEPAAHHPLPVPGLVAVSIDFPLALPL